MFHFLRKLVILSNANRRSTPVGAKVNGSRFAALSLNLNRSLVFLIKSFFIVLSSRERTKAPGTEFCSRMKLCS